MWEKPVPISLQTGTGSFMQQMTQHKKWVHQGKISIDCSTCDAKFATKQILNMHVVTVYEKIKEFDCLISNNNFSHNSTLLKSCQSNLIAVK